MRDFNIVKQNIKTLQSQNAPDKDIDKYLQEEGWDPDEFLKKAKTQEISKGPQIIPGADLYETPEQKQTALVKQQEIDIPIEAQGLKQPGRTPEEIVSGMTVKPVEKVLTQAAKSFFAGMAGFSQKLDVMTDYISKKTGLDKGGIFKKSMELYNSNAEYWQRRSNELGPDIVNEILGEALGGAIPGIAEFSAGVPFAGFAGAAEASKEGKSEILGALKEGAKRAVLGKAFHFLKPYTKPVQVAGSAGIFGTQAAMEGSSNKEILKSALIGGLYGGLGPAGSMKLLEKGVEVPRELKTAPELKLDVENKDIPIEIKQAIEQQPKTELPQDVIKVIKTPEITEVTKEGKPVESEKRIINKVLTKEEFVNLEYKTPGGGASTTPKKIFELRNSGNIETLQDLSKYNDKFNYEEAIGKHDKGIGMTSGIEDAVKNNKPIKVYRAVPKDSEQNMIMPGGYVSESLDYAKKHGENILKGDYKILKETVYPDELHSYGDPHEFIYSPKNEDIAYKRYLKQKKIKTESIAETELSDMPDFLKTETVPEKLKKLAQELINKEGVEIAKNKIREIEKIAKDFSEAPMSNLLPAARDKIMGTARMLHDELLGSEGPQYLTGSEMKQGAEFTTYSRSKSSRPVWAQSLAADGYKYPAILKQLELIASGEEVTSELGKTMKKFVIEEALVFDPAGHDIAGVGNVYAPKGTPPQADLELVKAIYDSNYKLSKAEKSNIQFALKTGSITPEQVVKEILKKTPSAPLPMQKMIESMARYKESVLRKAEKLGEKEGQKITNERNKIRINKLQEIYKEKITETRNELKGKLSDYKATVKDMKGLQATLIKYTKMALPITERGKILTTLSKIKNVDGLRRAFEAVDTLAETAFRKELKTTIVDINKNMENIDIDYQERIADLTKQLKFKNQREDTRDKLLQMEIYMWNNNVKLSQLPKNQQAKLQQSWKTHIDDLDTSQIIDLKNKIEHLYDLGRTKRKVIRDTELLQKDLVLKALDANKDKVNFDVPEVKTEDIGAKYNLNEKTLKQTRQIQSKFRRGILDIEYIDRLIDWADGFKKYTGPLYKAIKEPLDIASTNYDRMHLPILDAFYSLEKELNLDPGNYKRIGVHALRVQENGINKLIQSGYRIDQIKRVILTPQEERMYKFMVQSFDSVFPLMDKVLRYTENRTVPKVKNYFRMVTDYDNTVNIADKVWTNEKVTSTETGSLQARKANAKQIVSIDAKDIFLKSMDENIYYVTHEKTSRAINKVISDPAFKEGYGLELTKRMVDYMTMVNKKGVPADPKDIPVLNALRHNAAIAFLTLKVTTVLKQFIPLLIGSAEIGGKNVRQGMRMIATDPEMRKFTLKASPELRNRLTQYQDLYGEDMTWPIFKNLEEFGIGVLRRADGITAQSVWMGDYLARLKEVGIKFDPAVVDAKAARHADRTVRLTQGSGRFKDLPAALTQQYRSVGRAMFIFQSFMLNEWGFLKHDIVKYGFKNPDPLKTSQQLLWLTLALMAETAIDYGAYSLVTKKKYADENSLTLAGLQSMMSRIPVAGNLAYWIQRGKITHPLIDPANDILKNIKPLLSGDQEKSFKAAVKEVQAIAIIVGVPGVAQGKQIQRMFEKAAADTGTTQKRVERKARSKRKARKERR